MIFCLSGEIDFDKTVPRTKMELFLRPSDTSTAEVYCLPLSNNVWFMMVCWVDWLCVCHCVDFLVCLANTLRTTHYNGIVFEEFRVNKCDVIHYLRKVKNGRWCFYIAHLSKALYDVLYIHAFTHTLRVHSLSQIHFNTKPGDADDRTGNHTIPNQPFYPHSHCLLPLRY